MQILTIILNKKFAKWLLDGCIMVHVLIVKFHWRRGLGVPEIELNREKYDKVSND